MAINKGGRPTKLTPELRELAKGYLPSCVDDIENKIVKLPSVESFAVWLNVSRDILYDWAKEDEEFSYTLKAIKELQAERLINNGLAGTYNPTIAKLILSANHGMVERSTQDLTSNGESLGVVMLPIKQINEDTLVSTTKTSDSPSE